MTQTQTPLRQLMQHLRVKAPAAKVYKALTDAEQLQQWFPKHATTDPRVGGSLRFEFQKDGADVPHVVEGRFLELVPNRLVRYNWISPLDDDGQVLANLTVEFRLEAHGDETDVYLTETGYGEGGLHDEMYGDRTRGWSFLLSNLASVYGGSGDLRASWKGTCG